MGRECAGRPAAAVSPAASSGGGRGWGVDGEVSSMVSGRPPESLDETREARAGHPDQC